MLVVGLFFSSTSCISWRKALQIVTLCWTDILRQIYSLIVVILSQNTHELILHQMVVSCMCMCRQHLISWSFYQGFHNELAVILLKVPCLEAQHKYLLLTL